MGKINTKDSFAGSEVGKQKEPGKTPGSQYACTFKGKALKGFPKDKQTIMFDQIGDKDLSLIMGLDLDKYLNNIRLKAEREALELAAIEVMPETLKKVINSPLMPNRKRISHSDFLTAFESGNDDVESFLNLFERDKENAIVPLPHLLDTWISRASKMIKPYVLTAITNLATIQIEPGSFISIDEVKDSFCGIILLNKHFLPMKDGQLKPGKKEKSKSITENEPSPKFNWIASNKAAYQLIRMLKKEGLLSNDSSWMELAAVAKNAFSCFEDMAVDDIATELRRDQFAKQGGQGHKIDKIVNKTKSTD